MYHNCSLNLRHRCSASFVVNRHHHLGISKVVDRSNPDSDENLEPSSSGFVLFLSLNPRLAFPAPSPIMVNIVKGDII